MNISIKQIVFLTILTSSISGCSFFILVSLWDLVRKKVVIIQIQAYVEIYLIIIKQDIAI